ncbi:MAG: 4Fe-4S dicluster domain-containing protein [Methanobrevibacter sp.]|uniref:4Fe-4S dicluster domain-containing protein n=1 Tax=Methanobrevibacter millerae TaxID=230361 RepID=A0A8T3VJA5_9EURY|nr:ferredoxin:CoB-CoM heterodisulfide reductase subunit HdrC [Methanobrevibacter sp.]MBE6511262.1 4Fe-4S dicluster domain-containing protein [Methanobrevibacter millerae]MBO5150831.1 4Fe-4S dicluster domain-containing protein [Methanobrevibacter sp.]
MTSKQNIDDSPIDFAEKIIRDVKNSKEEGVLKCVQCGMCTSTCPAARHSNYNPRDIIERVLDGDVSILEDDLIWNCFYCYTCHSVCPVGNSVCEVNQILKQIAISNEIGYDKLYEYMGFADSYFTAAIGAIPEIFFDDIDRDVPGWRDFRNNLGEIRDELELDPPLMPPKEVIDEVSKILTITGFKAKIEKIRQSQEVEK